MKFAENFKGLGKKLFNPIQNMLSKLKIIYQINLIILIMAIFLVVQGIMALSTFHKMEVNTQKVFGTSVQGFQTAIMIRQEFNNIQDLYTNSLLDNQPLALTLYNLDATVQTLKGMVPETAVSQVVILEKQTGELKNFLKRPVSRQNFTELKNRLNVLVMTLKNVEDALNSNTLESMEQGNHFYELSRTTNVVLLIVSLLVSVIIGFAVTTLIAKPLKKMVETVGLLAAGDFTQSLNLKGSREVNQLVDSLNHAVMSLRKLISNVQEEVHVLARSGKELSDAANESGRSASEVAMAIENMAKSTAEQADQINHTATNVTKLGTLVQKVTNDSIRIANLSGQVAESAKEGQTISTNVAVSIGELYNTTKAVSKVIDEMNRSSERIKEITSLIQGIAEQTTLLALNASIEAARAGVHGRGFSVVAHETGKLAEQSKQASQTISALINEMIDHSAQAVGVIQKGVAEAEKGKTLTVEAETTFKNIFEHLGSTLTQINEVAVSAEQMAKHNDQVVGAVTSVAAISEEGMATTEEISATVQEQSASAEEVAALAANLSEIAVSMNKAVSAFKI
ncbi:MAG TPA: HAMP domain-containing methyl-accepting chemotaxis protein [Bacillota bacterium]|nr:HAMP domain-containing methyl-accepting chemotaxis protein [Bacillota bacterium]